MKSILVGLVLVISPFSFHIAKAASSDIEEASDALCKKLQFCIRKEMAAQMGDKDIPEQMKTMMEQMITGMCERYTPDTAVLNNNKELASLGAACLNDMADLSCNEFEQEKEPASCQRFKAAAEAQGIDVES